MKYKDLGRCIPEGKLIAFDTETTGLRYWQGDQPYAYSFCNEKHEVGYIDFEVCPDTRTVFYTEEAQQIIDFLEDDTRNKIGHNLSFDIRMSELALGCKVKGELNDTYCSMSILDSAELSYGLKPLSIKYLGISDLDQLELKALVKKCRGQAKKLGYKIHNSVEADYWLVKSLFPEDQLCRRYAILDALRTMVLFQLSYDELKKDSKALDKYLFEMRELFPVVYAMESYGVNLDSEVNDTQIVICEKEILRASTNLKKLAGREDFNPDSPKQVSELLFETLGYEVKQYTKNNNPSTGKEALAHYQHKPEIKDLFDYRAKTKGLGTFFKVYKERKTADHIVEGGYCIHPDVRQFGKRTGRFSYANPNLQGTGDISGSQEQGSSSGRKPFGPRKGYSWLLCDYSQLEVRVFASCSQSPELLEALETGVDLHTQTANKAWGGLHDRAVEVAAQALGTDSYKEAFSWLKSFDGDIVEAEASLGKKTHRAIGKTIFFARCFGGGPDAIYNKLGVSWAEASDFITSFDRAMPSIIQYVRDRANESIELGGFIHTLYGTKLIVPSREEYVAANYTVQGTAADLIKITMVNLDAYFKAVGLRDRINLVMQVHDELILEVKDGTLTTRILNNVKTIMENHEEVIGLPTPIKIERAVKSWAETEVLEF